MLDEYPPILTTEEVARILRLSERTVLKFAREGTIPAMKVGGQFRFSRDKLAEWIERQMAGGEFALWERLPQWHGGVAELLSPECVLTGFSATREEEAFQKMVDAAFRAGRVKDPEELVRLVLIRERQCSTVMRPGVAFPHPRAVGPEVVPEYALVLAISPEGVPFSDAPGDGDVHFIALFAIPSLQLHLKILAALGELFSHEEVQERLLSARSPQEVISHITSYEKEREKDDV
ncbi:putative PTS IIA-like nitrogen-regulatory protein PtsN [Spirochaeta thermophila DSM 6578]|uniref:PTS IIA-like nitrogen-regulatory protein PtsN n=1 Tax=Winmispira thermophila (strain ATCC 700085 / DSM 6578 / Z-1203) TaxID=869211 RepID=G0GDZ4_WINT7|nr:PTS sugar transporter subunit IIA [Spirochaeta thermophila]AEJ60626.1 putative PTS IIA-like nitrogen-regulatory protein PtsN [Spirochaeta thermophila DSM 6578]